MGDELQRGHFVSVTEWKHRYLKIQIKQMRSVSKSKYVL
jgi:hypothetical protein